MLSLTPFAKGPVFGRPLFPAPERFLPMPSAVIKRFDYRPESQELDVLFVTGRRYLYSGVPEEEAQAFRSAFAKGVHFNKYIRDRYPCTEVVE